MEKHVLWPLVVWEVLVNVYLTALFLGPLRELYSVQNRPQSKMRKVAIRTFVGVCVTLTTSVANLSVLTALDGEQGWVCLLICTSDGTYCLRPRSTADIKQYSCRSWSYTG